MNDEQFLKDLKTLAKLCGFNTYFDTYLYHYGNAKNNKDIASVKNKCCGTCNTNKASESTRYKGFEMSNFEIDNDGSGVALTYIVPGVNKNDITVNIIENICEVNCDKDIPYFGKLKSKVKMNFDIDFDKTNSKLENGVLKINIYKKVAKQNTIKVNID